MTWLSSLLILAVSASSRTEDKFQSVDVDHQFASRAYGTGDYSRIYGALPVHTTDLLSIATKLCRRQVLTVIACTSWCHVLMVA
jgi:hypothetical protein